MSNLYRIKSASLPIGLAMPTAARLPFLVNGEPATLPFPSPVPGGTFDASLANSTLAGIPFFLRAAGRTAVVLGTQYQIDISQYNASSGALVAVASTGLLTAVSSSPDSWALEVSAVWDDTTQDFRGSFSGFSGNAFNPIVSASSLESGGLTGVLAAQLIFVVAITTNTANSSNSFTLTDMLFDFV
jgi:hypothetical protein